MSINPKIITLVGKEKARQIFNEISSLTESGDNLIYYNKLQRNLPISAPTINKYLNNLLGLNIISINSAEGEMSEYYQIKKTGKKVNRIRRMWVRQIKIQDNNNTKMFKTLSSHYDRK